MVGSSRVTLTQRQVRALADELQSAWNAHDLDRIMTHYAKDVVLTTPAATTLLGKSDVRGEDALRKYFKMRLTQSPELRFRVMAVAAGVDSMVIHYINHQNRNIFDYVHLNPSGKIDQVISHIQGPTPKPMKQMR